MKHLDATLRSFAESNLPTLPQVYTWKLNASVLQQSFGLTLAGTNGYERTRELKRKLAQAWASSPPPRRTELADYAVRVWGGVRGNAAKTLQGYVDVVSQGEVPATHKGIASWSKVAAFSDPERHAIFDARVSFSLNAIQWLAKDEAPCWWFPKLPGRNTHLKEAWPILKERADAERWTRVGTRETYSSYIQLLEQTAGPLGVDIGDIEMLLFAKATELANLVRPAARPGSTPCR
jgi:hypothetical protein